jgi:membrane protease YdiL (CAAX protease family)
MIGIIIQLAISWLLIWLFERKGLSPLGLLPTRKRLLDLCLFFIVTAILCASGFFMRMYFGESFILNPALNGNLFFGGLWWHVKSVLFEELIFRGALLYILIRKLGVQKAIIISAIAFGVYHWFSHEVIGSPQQMAITFLTTGIMGLLHAYAYAKTFSLYIPIAMHLGWNFTHGFIFPGGPIGNGVLVSAVPWRVVTVPYSTYYFIVFFPLVSTLLINYLLLKRKKQAAPDEAVSKTPF